MGYSVPAIANSGEEAIECARSTPFDLVLMDIRLKGELDGIATAELLKDNWQTPVVYLTAHADQDTVGRAKMTEPFGYVLKPVTDGSLSTTVQIALYKAEMERRLRTKRSLALDDTPQCWRPLSRPIAPVRSSSRIPSPSN
jgi:CheY-like chemotaxis protein